MARLNQDLSHVSDENQFDPVPAGDYRVMVEDTKVFKAKSGNDCLAITFEIIDERYAGRKIFENFVLNNNVAQQRLKNLAISARHSNPNFIKDSEELHGLECLARVKVEDGQGGYGPQNKITNFKPLVRPTNAPAYAAHQTMPQTSPVQNPWQNSPQPVPQAPPAQPPPITPPPVQQPTTGQAPGRPWDKPQTNGHKAPF